MTVEITSLIEDVKQSLYYFLNHTTYTKDSTTQLLNQHFPGLNIVLGFPGDLEKLRLPTLAIVGGTVLPYNYLTFGQGAALNEIAFPFVIYGFCGGHQHEGQNQRQRDRLLNDLKELLTESEYLSYYEGSDFSSAVSDLGIKDITGSVLPETGMTESEKFRFEVNFQLVYIKES